MTVTVVIPVKPFALAKTRLAPALDARARAALARACFGQVLAAARAATTADRIEVHSSCPQVLAMAGGAAVAESGCGLNAVLAAARSASEARGDRAMIALFADLPLLQPAEIDALIAATLRDGLALAPDRAGLGTNALGLRRGVPLPFRFGPGSLAAFMAEARSTGRTAALIDRAGLASDVDVPADLALIPAELRWDREPQSELAREASHAP